MAKKLVKTTLPGPLAVFLLDHPWLNQAVLTGSTPEFAALGIGTATVPHGGIGAAMLALNGSNASNFGPHIQTTTGSDDYPLLQILSWEHDNIEIMFDAYYASGFKSSDAGSNFNIRKYQDKLRINVDSGIAQGGAVSWTEGLTVDTAGNITTGWQAGNFINIGTNGFDNSAGALNNGVYFYKSGTTSYGAKLQYDYETSQWGTLLFGPNSSGSWVGFGRCGASLEDDDFTIYGRIDFSSGYFGLGTGAPWHQIHAKSAATLQPIVVLENNYDDTNGPSLFFCNFRDNPANGDDTGRIRFYGYNNISEQVYYSYIRGDVIDNPNGSESGGLTFVNRMDGTLRNFLNMYGEDNNTGQVVINEDGQDINFRVEASGEANALFVNGADGKIGMGTVPTAGSLHAKGTAANYPYLYFQSDHDGSGGPFLNFHLDSASPADDDVIAQMVFNTRDSGANNAQVAEFRAIAEDVTDGDEAGGFQFHCMMDGTLREMLRLSGYNGTVNDGEIVINEDGQDVNFRIEAATRANGFCVRGSDGRVGVGIAAPDGTLHVHSASAGGVTASTNANDLVVEGTGNTGISILGRDQDQAAVYLGSPSANVHGFIASDYNASLMRIGSYKSGAGMALETDLAVEAVRITSTGAVGLGTVSPDELLHIYSATSQKPVLLLENANEDLHPAVLRFKKSSASPADYDGIGDIDFYGENNVAQEVRFAQIEAFARDVTDGTEDGELKFNVMIDGTARQVLELSNDDVVFNASQLDIDFELYYDSGIAFFINGYTGNVGIGTQSPGTDLHIYSAAANEPDVRFENANDGSGGASLTFIKNSDTPADGDFLGTIQWYGDDSGGTQGRFGRTVMRSIDVTNGDEAGEIYWKLMMDGTEREFLRLSAYNGSVNEGEIVFNEGGQDVDFRVEASGEANAFVIYGDASKIAIGIPLLFSAGSLASETAGGLEFYNDRFYVTNVATRRAVDRTSDVKTSTTTVENTTTETTIYTATVDANEWRAENVLKIFCSGVVSNASASDDLTIRVKIGSTTVASYNPAMGNVSGADWHLKQKMTIRSVGATGSVAVHGKIEIDGNTQYNNSIETIDTTASEDITVTVEWDNVDAGNVFNCYQGIYEMKN